jgi:pyruvate dehydrogenase E2 component (dihydrolipoamide acetyltransferase)
VLFEMETDKAVVEVGAPSTGVLLKVMASQGLVKVGAVVGWIGQPGDPIEETAGVHAFLEEGAPSPPVRSAVEPRPARILATPAARKRASELGISLEKARSTTPGERITQEDVERAAGVNAELSKKSAARLGDRKVLIERLVNTWRSVPHIHIASYLDVSGLVEAKKKLADREISVTDLLLHLLALLMPRFPQLSQVWKGDELVAATETNLAFAIDTDRGVVAPVISGANVLSLKARSQKRRELGDAARTHRLRPQQLQGAVFTLTNLGMQDVDFFAPVINAPQTAILATGKIRQVPVVANGVVCVGWRMWANLAVDHRAADGMAAAEFLKQLQIEVGQLTKTLDSNG